MAAKSSPNKKGATRHAKPTPPSAPVKWWLWLLVPTLVGAFIFGLAQLSKVPTTASSQAKTPANAATTPEKKPTTSKAAPKTAGEKKDTFEFYQILQDSEVDTSHVDAYQSTPRGEQDFLYMIQAASFRSNSDADRLRAKLILSGLNANIRQTTGEDDRAWYRVVLGPYDSRSKMNRAQDKLVSMDIQSYSYKIKKEP